MNDSHRSSYTLMRILSVSSDLNNTFTSQSWRLPEFSDFKTPDLRDQPRPHCLAPFFGAQLHKHTYVKCRESSVVSSRNGQGPSTLTIVDFPDPAR